MAEDELDRGRRLMELPRPLQPWAEELEILAPHLATSLGGLLPRLASFFGPLRRRPRAGMGEPDGFDGLTRRGPYERLLLSEWLLAEEAPDEFSRRASTGEHAFLELSRQEPASMRRSVVLLDCAPDQLGPPRLVQLASLIVLFRRAANVGAEFHWGLIQASSLRLRTGLERDDLQLSFLSGRHGWVHSIDGDAWREQLEALDLIDEVLVLGGPTVVSLARELSARLVRIDDVLELGPMQVELRLEPAQGTRPLRLTLPADQDRGRLLRDPFRQPHQRTRTSLDRKKAGPAHALRISATGRQVFVRHEQGLGMAGLPPRYAEPQVPLVQSIPEHLIKLHRIDPERRIIAVGRLGKRLAGALTLTDDRFEVIGLRDETATSLFWRDEPPWNELVPTETGVLADLHLDPSAGHWREGLHVVDGSSRLHRFDCQTDWSRMTTREGIVVLASLGTAGSRRSLTWVGIDDEQGTVLGRQIDQRERSFALPDGGCAASFGATRQGELVLGLLMGDDCWRVAMLRDWEAGRKPVILNPLAKTVIAPFSWGDEVGLIVQEETGDVISALSLKGRRVLHRSKDVLIDVVASPMDDRLVGLTVDGRLLILEVESLLAADEPELRA
ncbi:MAG: hypothetical protein AAF533_11140 [Acidobacteriota bacterium]